MAACALMYPLRLYFGGWGLGMGDGDINPPPKCKHVNLF